MDVQFFIKMAMKGEIVSKLGVLGVFAYMKKHPRYWII